MSTELQTTAPTVLTSHPNGAAALAAGVTFGAETNQHEPQHEPIEEQGDQEQIEPMHESEIRMRNVNELKRQRDDMETHYFGSYKKARMLAHELIEDMFNQVETQARNSFDSELNERSKRLEKAVEDANTQQAYHEHMTENMRRVFRS